MSNITLGMDDATLQNESKPNFKGLEVDTYYPGEVIATPFVEVNTNSGNYQLCIPVAPLDEDGQVMKPTVRWYITLPWLTAPALLEMAGLTEDYQAKQLEAKKQAVPKTLFQLVAYARAAYGEDEFPRYPSKDKDTGDIVFKGETVESWEVAEGIRTNLNRKADQLFQELLGAMADESNWEINENNGRPTCQLDTFIGDSFYFTVEDKPSEDGSRVYQQLVTDFKKGAPVNTVPDGASFIYSETE